MSFTYQREREIDIGEEKPENVEEEFDFDSETVGGWVLESFGRFPKAGDTFSFLDRSVSVLRMDGRRVDRVLLTKNKSME